MGVGVKPSQLGIESAETGTLTSSSPDPQYENTDVNNWIKKALIE